MLKFLNQKRQQYDWDNDDLEYDKGLIKPDIAHPDIPAEFPGIDLESEHPCHHQVVEVIEESKDEHIYAAQCNASLDDLPHKPTGVSTSVNEIEVDNWANLPEKMTSIMTYPPNLRLLFPRSPS